MTRYLIRFRFTRFATDVDGRPGEWSAWGEPWVTAPGKELGLAAPKLERNGWRQDFFSTAEIEEPPATTELKETGT